MRTMLTVLLTLVFLSPGAYASSRTCENLLKSVRFELLAEDFVKANGVAITGEFIYPLPMVLTNLELDETKLHQWQGKTILSIGEGASGLVPHLRKAGLNATGLDLWYGTDDFPSNFTGRIMRDYMAANGEHLIQGDAQKIPLPDESVDLIVSHLLINNVDQKVQRKILNDSIRVLKNGGQIRMFGFDEEDLMSAVRYLIAAHKDQVTFTTEYKEYSYVFRGRQSDRDDYLLTITKLDPKNKPARKASQSYGSVSCSFSATGWGPTWKCRE